MEYLVMECGLSYAVVMDQDGRILKVPNLGYTVGQTLEDVVLLPERPAKATIHKRVARWGTMVACLCLLLLGSWVWQSPIGTVRMQINPDVQMSVNRFDRVVALEARSFGDLSENSEYDEAKNEQAKLYGRIAEVENILAHAVIIDENEDAEGKIGLGCTIKVLDMETEEEEIYAIVGSQEANPMECRISDDSPFGKALLGHTVGEIVEVEAPIGTLRYKILSVER